jgi:Spy/CpxP family protein refolding chaperone
MNSSSKSGWFVRVAVLGIFLLGFAAGALAPAAYRAWVRDGRRERRQDRFEQMSERVGLSPEQKTRVQQIFGETRSELEAVRRETAPRYAEIRRQADERIRQVLTPEQWERFRLSREESRPRGRRGKAGAGERPPASER